MCQPINSKTITTPLHLNYHDLNILEGSSTNMQKNNNPEESPNPNTFSQHCKKQFLHSKNASTWLQKFCTFYNTVIV